jgi:plastocyanin
MTLRLARSLAVPSLVFMAAAPASAATIEVTIKQLVFAPAQISVKPGDTIERVNQDFVAHTATARNKSFDVQIPPMAKEATRSPRPKAARLSGLSSRCKVASPDNGGAISAMGNGGKIAMATIAVSSMLAGAAQEKSRIPAESHAGFRRIRVRFVPGISTLLTFLIAS